MPYLSDKEFDQLRDALRLAVIHCEEHPTDSSPVRQVREAFKLVAEGSANQPDRVGVLEQTLTTVLGAIYDQSTGALLRPSMEIVDQVKLVLP